jgi:hypothetical protein
MNPVYRIFFLIVLQVTYCSCLYSQAYSDLAGFYGIVFNNQTLTPDGGGVSFADFNGDGLDDISLATGLGDSLEFYQNTGTGFTKLASLVDHTQEAKHLIWVDYDNDGDKDLYITSNISANKLYRNDNGSFADVSNSAGLSSSVTETYGACWGDINNDGWLDLYEANQLNFGAGYNTLYLSDGNGSFTDITTSANAGDSIRYAFAPAFLDYDKDGYQDIFVANDRLAPTTLLKNNGDSTFTNVASSVGAREIMDGMSATVGDFDNNGWLDIYVTNTTYGNKLFRNNGNGTFSEVASQYSLEHFSETWNAVFFDFDLDGDLDIHVCDVILGQSTAETFYENVDTNFIQSSHFPGDTLKNYCSAIGDINSDGYIDLVSPNKFPSQLQLWEHNGVGSNHFVKVRLEGVASNRDGIGSYIEVYSGGDSYMRYTHCGEGFQSQNSLTEIIGLGSHTIIDSMVVRWLSGHVDRFDSLVVDTLYAIKEGSSMDARIQVTGSEVICAGDSAANTILGLSEAYHQYLWSTGDTTATISVSQPGIYHVVVGNSFGLTDTSETVEIKLDSMALSASATPDTNLLGLGTATVNVVGDYPPFSVQWDDAMSQTGSTATGLMPGNYTAEVTDSVGCQDSISVRVDNFSDASISEFQNQHLKLFPVPTRDKINLLWESNQYPEGPQATIVLRDITGAMVYEASWDMREEIRIDLSAIKSGNYLLEIISHSGSRMAQQKLQLLPE